MMTKEMMITAIEALEADASLWDEEEYCLDVTLNDLEGSYNFWKEVDREYDDEEAVNAFLEMLDNECICREDNFYVVYHFEDFDVQIGYASFDI